MKSTLVMLILTAFATSVFAIEQITATESAAPAAAACSSCEAACSSCDAACGGEKSCCQQSESAAAGDAASDTVSAKVASTAATTACCGDERGCCSGSACSKGATSATLAATATTSVCGAGSKCCSEGGCSKQATSAATNPSPPGAAAQWTAATTDFATVVADAATADSPCCVGDCQCPHECTQAGCGACSTATAAELERTGVDPYRIECPDELTIYLPALQATCAEMQKELTARGILSEVQLPFVGKTIRQIVQPDGNISLEDIGTVYVSGRTIEEARLAILKKAIEANPQAARATFGVFIDVTERNSKQAYIILEGGQSGDRVIKARATPESTVGSALKNIIWPQPIDFASAKIWIARPGHDGCRETVLPVTWNCEAGQPTCETNHALVPDDRLFVRQETEDSLPVPPPPVSSIEFPVLPHPISYYQPFVPAEPRPEMPIAFDLPAPPPVMRYSAIPVAAPSPFAPQPSVIQASPSSIPEPTYASTILQHQAPASISAKSATCAESASWAHDGKRVEFEIAVYEDLTGSFAEFPKIRDGLLMVSDSDPTLSAVRIMEKQKLVKRLAAPRLRCALGEQATLCVESNCETENGETKTDSLTMNVTANGAAPGIDGMTMYIETATQITRGDQVCGTTIGYRIEEGQTAILRTRLQCRPASNDAEHPVYVVVTPKLVR